jgi:hypothetical protein
MSTHRTARRPISPGPRVNCWQARRESNPQPAVLETAALPIELLAYSIGRNRLRRFRRNYLITSHWQRLREGCAPAYRSPHHSYFKIFATTPAPTVLPPSRIAKRSPSSIAIGLISSIVILMLSPGITISTPAGNSIIPVTSVVRK